MTAVLDLTAFGLEQLRLLPPDRGMHVKGDAAWIRCPLHGGGNEKTPSAKVNLSSGRDKAVPLLFYCFGCHQTLNWNTFAELFGLKKISQGKMKQIMSETFKDMRLAEALPPDYSQFMCWPEGADWRGISGKILKRFKARSIKYGREFRMYLPVTTYGENKGGINCRLDKDKSGDGKSYVNSSGEWSHSSLLGFDQARKRSGPLWVVEGPRDTLNVFQHTYNHNGRVAGIIGSKITKEKIELIKELDPPSVLIATDPDDAGDEAAARLAYELKGSIPNKRYKFEEDTDPAMLTRKQIRSATDKMVKLFGE